MICTVSVAYLSIGWLLAGVWSMETLADRIQAQPEDVIIESEAVNQSLPESPSQVPAVPRDNSSQIPAESQKSPPSMQQNTERTSSPSKTRTGRHKQARGEDADGEENKDLDKDPDTDPQKAVSDNSVSKNSISKDSISKDSISKDSISKDSISKNSISNNSISKNTISHQYRDISQNYLLSDENPVNNQSNPLIQNQRNLSEQSKQNNSNISETQVKQVSRAEEERRMWIAGFTLIYGVAVLLWLIRFHFKGGKEKMKTLWKKVTGCLLILICLAAVAPLQLQAASDQTDCDAGKEILLFEADPLQTPTDILNAALGNSSWEDIGVWLRSMDDETLKELLERDTFLAQETSVTEYEVDENGDMTPMGKPKELLFYEYALEKADLKARATYFGNKSGYYQYQFIKQNQTCTFTVKLSGIDTTVSTATQQKVTVSVSKSGTNFADFSQNIGSYNTTGGTTTLKFSRALGATTGNFYMACIPFHFTKPKGYTGSVNYQNNNPLVKGSLYFYDSGNYASSQKRYNDTNADADVAESVVACTNVTHNTSVGSDSAQGQAMIYQIVFTPVSFTTVYNGNGATGGSVASQSNIYDNSYAVAANGFSRQYTVNFNGNGGTPSQSGALASYSFAGWGLNQKTTVTHQPGQTYSNYTTTGGGTGTFYAIWSAAGVKLPSASRTGYTFKGWSTNSGATSGTAEGGVYTPTANTTLYATWAANHYTIRFYDGFTDTIKGSQSMTYGTSAPLSGSSQMGISRDGYTFKGWMSSSGTYQDGQKVSNLTAENGGCVELTALWEQNGDTEFRVEHYKEQTQGKDDYQIADTDKLQGMTGTSVTPATRFYDGYQSPGMQTVTICGDGSTVVKYYYKVKESTPEVTNITNNYGSPSLNEGSQPGQGDINDFKAGDTRYFKDASGNKYEIYVNQDGTLTIRSMSAAGSAAKDLKVAGILTINNTKYTVTEIAPYAFKNNKEIRSVTIGSSINKIGKSAFEGCTKLKSVKLGTSINSIGARAFYGCTALEIVKTNRALTVIGSKAFYNCKNLKSYTIGKYVKSIGSGAFYNCKKLKKITVAESVERIEKQAFYKCGNLKDVNIKSLKLIKVGSGAFKKCKRNLKFTVPAKKKKAYTKLLKGKV